MTCATCRLPHPKLLTCETALLQQRIEVRAVFTTATRNLDLCRVTGHAGPALFPGLCARCVDALKTLYDRAREILGRGDGGDRASR